MMRPILQAEGSECSLACLAMICTAHGLHLELADLRRRFATSLKGANLQQLVAHAGSLGLAARPLRLELEHLDQLALPCILHWDLNHFVVLKKVGRRCVVLDPAVGERRLTTAEVSRHFTGIALELAPTSDFARKGPGRRLELRELTGPVRGLARSLAQIFVVAAVLELFALAAPLFNQVVIDDVLSSGDRELLMVLAIGFGLLVVTQAAIGLARSWMVMVLGQTLHLQWASNVFAHLVRLPVDFFERRHLGDVVSRFGAVATIQRTLTTTVIEAVIDGIMALGALALMFLYSWRLALFAAVAVAAYGAARWFTFRPAREATAERLVVAAKENSHFLETLRAMTPLKLFGREEDRRSRWQNLFVDVQNRDVRIERINIFLSNGKTFVIAMETLIVFGWGASFVIAGPAGPAGLFTVGMLLAFIAYNHQWMSRVTTLIDHAAQLRMLRLHAERLADIVLAAPERDLPVERDLGHLEPSLELRDVSFRYAQGEPWILRHASFVLPAGQSVAVTGASGCGKTTLLKLLLGLLPPTEGEVLYGGVAFAELGVGNVRRQLGAVMQEDVLLTGSLGDNITFFDAHPDEARGEACARLARIHDDIVRMPMGYQTLVGDLGTGLSGGQKQRLLLARALYKQPKVLALDEATSHLDVGNEHAVTQALAQMQLTRLVIAHRPGTIAGAERVVRIEQGQVVEVARSAPERAGAAARLTDVPAEDVGSTPA